MDRRAAKSAYLIRLAGREVEYRFVRRRRRTLGLTVDAEGLKISAPMRAPWRDIEGFVREKERWILAKLAEWSVAPRPVRLRGESGEFGHLLPVRSLRFAGHGHPSGQRRLPRSRSAIDHARARCRERGRQPVAGLVRVTKWDGLP